MGEGRLRSAYRYSVANHDSGNLPCVWNERVLGSHVTENDTELSLYYGGFRGAIVSVPTHRNNTIA